MALVLGEEWGEVSQLFKSAGDFAGAEDRLGSARRDKNRREEATALIALVKGHLVAAAPEKAAGLVAESREVFGDLKMPAGEAALLLSIADAQLSKGAADEALSVAQAALSVCQRVGSKKIEACNLQTVASAFLILARPEDALRTATRLMSIQTELDDKNGQGNAAAQIAQAQLAKQRFEPAIAKIQEAIALFTTAGNKSGAANALQSLGEAHVLQKSWADALEACSKASEKFAELGEDSGKASTLLVVASAQHGKGDSDAGLQAAREALVLFRQAGDKAGVQKAQSQCAKLRKQPALAAAVQNPAKFGVDNMCVPGASGPGTLEVGSNVAAVRVCGTWDTRSLSGLVTLVTGAGHGVGKGIAQMLAEAGAIVYATGRSDTIDALAPTLSKTGGAGVAVHVDHTDNTQNQALADLIAKNHGRLDVLVNNAFFSANPDEAYFKSSEWERKDAFLKEEVEECGFHHAAQTMMLLPCLRRGRGIVINVSSADTQLSGAALPPAVLEQKKAFEKSSAALAEKLQQHSVHVLTLCPGHVKTEKVIAAGLEKGVHYTDVESVGFSGQAVAFIARMSPAELFQVSAVHRRLSPADIARFENDSFKHEAGLRTFATSGRASYK